MEEYGERNVTILVANKYTDIIFSRGDCRK
jgi:hypothetical protein